MVDVKNLIIGMYVGAIAVTTASAIVMYNMRYKDNPQIKTYGNINYSEFSEKINKEDYWKLVIDGRFQKFGPKVCDIGVGGASEEPGYVDAMTFAFGKMIEGLGTKLTSEKLNELHNLAVSNVKNMLDNCNGWRQPGRSVHFNLIKTNSSPEGEKEFNNKVNSKWESDRITSDKNFQHFMTTGGNKQFYPICPNEDGWAQRCADIVLEEYYKRMSSLKCEQTEEKLKVIINICQNLDQMHLFPDGNIRTVAFLVLNKFLIENHMYPTIMNDPNVFDMKSVKEIMSEIIEGQKRFIKEFNK